MAAFREPLYLPTPELLKEQIVSKESTRPSSPPILNCLLCDEIFPTAGEQDFLKHLLETHNFVIEDVPSIADFPAYCSYWKQRFQTTELSWICATIQTTEQKTFHLLTKTLPEDVRLRDDLRQKRQETILGPLLEQKRRERADSETVRECLFCKKTFQGCSHALLQHMYFDHNFNVGRADNLVYIDEFLAALRSKLNDLICLYCERTFKSWDVLKEHMRKKQHKHINPNNKSYDRFYIVSYLLGDERAAGDCQADQGREVNDPAVDDLDPDRFEDWTEEQRFSLICLFCDRCDERWDEAFAHMKAQHGFDFDETRKNLGFYDQVKLVNYIRRQTHINVCYLCETQHQTRQDLLKHLDSAHKDGKVKPSRSKWDQPNYFFPTYENDELLYVLEDTRQDDVNEAWVLPEDPVEPNAQLLQQLSLNDDPEEDTEGHAGNVGE